MSLAMMARIAKLEKACEVLGGRLEAASEAAAEREAAVHAAIEAMRTDVALLLDEFGRESCQAEENQAPSATHATTPPKKAAKG